METLKEYEVEITSNGKLHYFKVLEYFYEIRIGDYRVIYTIDDVILIADVRNVGHRKDIYG